jgi:hypothetical protein
MEGDYTDFYSPFLRFASSVESFDSLLMSHVETDYVREK